MIILLFYSFYLELSAILISIFVFNLIVFVSITPDTKCVLLWYMYDIELSSDGRMLYRFHHLELSIDIATIYDIYFKLQLKCLRHHMIFIRYIIFEKRWVITFWLLEPYLLPEFTCSNAITAISTMNSDILLENRSNRQKICHRRSTDFIPLIWNKMSQNISGNGFTNNLKMIKK